VQLAVRLRGSHEAAPDAATISGAVAVSLLALTELAAGWTIRALQKTAAPYQLVPTAPLDLP
jgi:hypothetical protein